MPPLSSSYSIASWYQHHWPSSGDFRATGGDAMVYSKLILIHLLVRSASLYSSWFHRFVDLLSNVNGGFPSSNQRCQRHCQYRPRMPHRRLRLCRRHTTIVSDSPNSQPPGDWIFKLSAYFFWNDEIFLSAYYEAERAESDYWIWLRVFFLVGGGPAWSRRAWRVWQSGHVAHSQAVLKGRCAVCGVHCPSDNVVEVQIGLIVLDSVIEWSAFLFHIYGVLIPTSFVTLWLPSLSATMSWSMRNSNTDSYARSTTLSFIIFV